MQFGSRHLRARVSTAVTAGHLGRLGGSRRADAAAVRPALPARQRPAEGERPPGAREMRPGPRLGVGLCGVGKGGRAWNWLPEAVTLSRVTIGVLRGAASSYSLSPPTPTVSPPRPHCVSFPHPQLCLSYLVPHSLSSPAPTVSLTPRPALFFFAPPAPHCLSLPPPPPPCLSSPAPTVSLPSAPHCVSLSRSGPLSTSATLGFDLALSLASRGLRWSGTRSGPVAGECWFSRSPSSLCVLPGRTPPARSAQKREEYLPRARGPACCPPASSIRSCPGTLGHPAVASGQRRTV